MDASPFTGAKVYYSGSIKGSPELDPQFAWKLVSYMTEQGADVLTEHVAAITGSDMQRIMSDRTGRSMYDLFEGPEAAVNIRKHDMAWVDQATHVVALVNAPSHGVGMEIERALLKPQRGLPVTPILCLVHEDVRPLLSAMIVGISPLECPVFSLQSYSSFEDACELIHRFLAK